MNLEGKVMGYDKKIIAIMVLVLAALVIFYAGTRYEKMRINSAVSKSTKTSTDATTKKSKNVPAATTEVAPTTTGTNTAVTPTPATTTTPATK